MLVYEAFKTIGMLFFLLSLLLYAMLRLYKGSKKARACRTTNKAQLFGSMKALCRLYEGSIKALIKAVHAGRRTKRTSSSGCTPCVRPPFARWLLSCGGCAVACVCSRMLAYVCSRMLAYVCSRMLAHAGGCAVACAAARRTAAVRDCRDCRDLSIRVANPVGNTTALGSRCVCACVRERCRLQVCMCERERKRE